mmetsp:Transcript_89547/g.289658  ORF Transcript_89547/g.289658 Transcript_89547/m.289658 type:complete len:200 (+) Transcript_89547:135-734(+)
MPLLVDLEGALKQLPLPLDVSQPAVGVPQVDQCDGDIVVVWAEDGLLQLKRTLQQISFPFGISRAATRDAQVVQARGERRVVGGVLALQLLQSNLTQPDGGGPLVGMVACRANKLQPISTGFEGGLDTGQVDVLGGAPAHARAEQPLCGIPSRPLLLQADPASGCPVAPFCLLSHTSFEPGRRRKRWPGKGRLRRGRRS